MVIADGRLFWIVDAYTTTELLPVLEPQGGLNYIRNSVKAVIDAYNGTMTFYVFDADRPAPAHLREDLPRHVHAARADARRRCARTCATRRTTSTCRREVFATYHVKDPACSTTRATSGRSRTTWRSRGPAGRWQAYYVIMRLPGADKEEFLLMLPFVPNGRSNMIGWLGAPSRTRPTTARR